MDRRRLHDAVGSAIGCPCPLRPRTVCGSTRNTKGIRVSPRRTVRAKSWIERLKSRPVEPVRPERPLSEPWGALSTDKDPDAARSNLLEESFISEDIPSFDGGLSQSLRGRVNSGVERFFHDLSRGEHSCSPRHMSLVQQSSLENKLGPNRMLATAMCSPTPSWPVAQPRQPWWHGVIVASGGKPPPIQTSPSVLLSEQPGRPLREPSRPLSRQCASQTRKQPSQFPRMLANLVDVEAQKVLSPADFGTDAAAASDLPEDNFGPDCPDCWSVSPVPSAGEFAADWRLDDAPKSQQDDSSDIDEKDNSHEFPSLSDFGPTTTLKRPSVSQSPVDVPLGEVGNTLGGKNRRPRKSFSYNSRVSWADDMGKTRSKTTSFSAASPQAKNPLDGTSSPAEEIDDFWSLPNVHVLPTTPLQFMRIAKQHQVEVFEVRDHLEDFQRFDIDGSGALSPSEFASAIRTQLGLSTDGELPRAAKSEVDRLAGADGNGLVTFDDYITWSLTMRFATHTKISSQHDKSLREYAWGHNLDLTYVEKTFAEFKHFDVDGNGLLDRNEFTKLLQCLLNIKDKFDVPAARVTRFYKEVDKDENGLISFDEFLVWYMKYFPIMSDAPNQIPALAVYQTPRRLNTRSGTRMSAMNK